MLFISQQGSMQEGKTAFIQMAFKAILEIAVEQRRQANAQFLNIASRYRSHTSAHSSQMPTQSNAI
jgi:hypothetical protein